MSADPSRRENIGKEIRFVVRLVREGLVDEVHRLVEGVMEAGYHHVTWDGLAASSRPVPWGIYIAVLLDKPGW